MAVGFAVALLFEGVAATVATVTGNPTLLSSAVWKDAAASDARILFDSVLDAADPPDPMLVTTSNTTVKVAVDRRRFTECFDLSVEPKATTTPKLRKSDAGTPSCVATVVRNAPICMSLRPVTFRAFVVVRVNATCTVTLVIIVGCVVGL